MLGAAEQVPLHLARVTAAREVWVRSQQRLQQHTRAPRVDLGDGDEVAHRGVVAVEQRAQPAPQQDSAVVRLAHRGHQIHEADLDTIEMRVKAVGLTPFNHGDYEPGRRFYFFDPDGIEYEVVSYAEPRMR